MNFSKVCVMFRQVVHEVSSLETHAGSAPRENMGGVCMMSSLVKRTRLVSIRRTEDKCPVCAEGCENPRGLPAEHISSDIPSQYNLPLCPLALFQGHGYGIKFKNIPEKN